MKERIEETPYLNYKRNNEGKYIIIYNYIDSSVLHYG